MKTLKLITLGGLFAFMTLCLNSCVKEDPKDSADKDAGSNDRTATKLMISSYTPRALMGDNLDNMTGYTLKVGSKEVVPQKDEQGNWYIDYVEDDYAKATICWKDAKLPFGARYDDSSAQIPFSQFYGKTMDLMKSYPLFAARKDKNGNFVFKDSFAMLDLDVKGSGSIISIKVRRLDGRPLATDGVDFVNLNCIREQEGPVALPARFQIPIKADTYQGGLEIIICDSKKQFKRIVSELPALGAGETKSMNINYVPASSIVLYEGFDNCVWGVDPAGLLAGYAPDTENPGFTGRKAATGYEDAFSVVPVGAAGTGFQQPDEWDNAYTVESSHTMTNSYVNSRGFFDWKYLFRTQEFQGCLGVGIKHEYRGWIETKALSNLTAKSDVNLSFRFLPILGSTEDIEIQCLNAGTINGATSYTIETDGLPQEWQQVSLDVKGATSATAFRIRGAQTASNTTRGFFFDDLTVSKAVAPAQISGVSSLSGLSSATMNFKFEFEENAAEGLTMELPTGGFITGMKIDGRDVDHPLTKTAAWPLVSSWTINPEYMYMGGEHTVEVFLESVDKDFSALFTGDACTYKDLSLTNVVPVKKGSFRLLLWNIQFGMWADQGNNYDNFVEWLKKYDADCCVFIEAETVRKTGSSAGESASAKKLNGSSGGTYGWSTLAGRYGHSYVSVSADRDNYSQEITSKTKITRVLALAETGNSKRPIYHGSGHFSLTAAGREINIVTYHAMPYNYDPNAANQTMSESLREGDAYRLDEVTYILDQTLKKNPSKSNWIFLGDMNSHSPVDNWYYGYSSTSILSVQNHIRDTGLKDVIAEKYPGRFLPTTMNGKFRIDYVYASDAMMNAVTNAVVIRDKWTSEKATAVADCTHPSDHRPILVDFKF